VHRSDGSGTSYIFTDYLSKVSQTWLDKAGRGTAVSWPVGLGGKGNEGVTGLVKQTPFSIGYVELIYALSNQIPYASVKNKAGDFVTPSLDSVTAAAASVTDMPDDFRVSITNAPGPGAYPIAGMTWLLVYEKQTDAEKGKKLVKFLDWMLRDGQKAAPDLHYAPLPAAVATKAQASLAKITSSDGAPCSDTEVPTDTMTLRAPDHAASAAGGRRRRTVEPGGREPALPSGGAAGTSVTRSSAVSRPRQRGRSSGSSCRSSRCWRGSRPAPCGPSGGASSRSRSGIRCQRVRRAPLHLRYPRLLLLALLQAVPLGIGTALFLSEMAPAWLRAPVSFLVELLAAIPSVVYGLWGIFVLVPWARNFIQPLLANTLGFLPFFQGPSYGVGMLTASIILAVMIVPYITSVALEVFRTVPTAQREGALALGATRWEMIRMAVLPYGRVGVIGAIMLGSDARSARRWRSPW
jgi:ABC-type proline/glycine betaine transport system permease subunit